MTPFAARRSHILALAAAAFSLALLAAPAAQAFTIEELGSVSNGDGARNAIADPDGRVSRFGSGSGNTYKQGNTTIQFGARPSFDQRYDNSRMFNPLGRPGEPDPR